MSLPSKFSTESYLDRVANFENPAARLLLECIDRKQSNLCVSVDVTTKAAVLEIMAAVGPYVCLVKTHADIVEDFDDDMIAQMQDLSKRHDFLIFEDRKFADIGNTVVLQYSRGVHKIASWAHITNAHPVPGPSVVAGLKSVGLKDGRGLLLLAEMSSKGNLAVGEYRSRAVELARENRDFVVGFIAMKRVEGDSDFLILTPGVGLDESGDGLGQQYRTPDQVVRESGCDVIIVGRGIYGSGSIERMVEEAQRYRLAGWEAYLARIS